MNARDGGHHFDEVIRLEQEGGIVGDASRRDGQLKLPRMRSRAGKLFEQGRELAPVATADLRIGGYLYARACKIGHGFQSGAMASNKASQGIVRRRHSVDRHRYA